MHVNHPTGVLLTLPAEKEKGPTLFGVGPFCFLVEAGGVEPPSDSKYYIRSQPTDDVAL